MGVQRPHRLDKHPNLCKPHLRRITMNSMKKKIGRTKVRGLCVPQNQCGVFDPSVVASTESNLAKLGPRSSIIIYWEPSSTPWALLDVCPVILVPAPIRMPAPTSLVPVLRVPRMGFLTCFGESFPDHFWGMNLITEFRSPF